MKAIILVAGMGKRMYPLTLHTPKCLLKLNTKSILEHQIGVLNKCGISEIVVVSGYKSGDVQREVGDKVNHIFNPFYRITNSIASLWLAKEIISPNEDVVILNGDIIFGEDILGGLIDCGEGMYMAVEKKNDCTDTDFKLRVIDGVVVDMGKTLSNSDSYGEYIGVVKITKGMIPQFVDALNQMMTNGKFTIWYELILQEMTRSGFEVNVFDTGKRYWIEVDTEEDLERARRGNERYNAV